MLPIGHVCDAVGSIHQNIVQNMKFKNPFSHGYEVKSQEEVAQNILGSDMVRSYNPCDREAVRKLLEGEVSKSHDQPGIGITQVDNIMMGWENSDHALISKDQVVDILRNGINLEAD
jgi:hypothetical protein